MRTPSLHQLRRVAVAATIAIGVFASVATSGGAIELSESDEFLVPVDELAEPYTRQIRACPGGSFFHRSDNVEPADIELAVRFEPGTDTEEVVPITFSTEDSKYRVVGNVQGSATSVAVGVTIPADEVLGWGDCSPWMNVVLGPASEQHLEGSLSWSVAIRTGVHYTNPTLPWNAAVDMTFEVRP
jgi:hypothetical protein